MKTSLSLSKSLQAVTCICYICSSLFHDISLKLKKQIIGHHERYVNIGK